jgi:hypothetical protein
VAETGIKTFALEMVGFIHHHHGQSTTEDSRHVNESACTTDEQDEAALAALGIDAVRQSPAHPWS